MTRTIAPCLPWHRPTSPAELETEASAETLEIRRQKAMARAHAAVLSHRSAARAHGWPVLHPPERLEVCVPGTRHVRPHPRLHIRQCLAPVDDDPAVTTPLATLLQCASALPFADGLAVADAALASELVGAETLRKAGAAFLGPGRARVRRVTTWADAGAANPFESALRALVLDVPEVHVVTQHEIQEGSFFARVDLADPALRLVFEADGYLFHGGKQDFADDVERYDELVALGWTVLRFTWAQVNDRPDWVRGHVRGAALARVRGERPRSLGRPDGTQR